MLVVGASYGSIALIAYLPAHITLRHVGDQLTRHLAGISEATRSEDRPSAVQRQGQFSAALGLDEGIWQQVHRVAGLIAPLVVALVATLLSDVKL